MNFVSGPDVVDRGVECVDADLEHAAQRPRLTAPRRVHSAPSDTALPVARPSTSPGENENGIPSSVLSVRLWSNPTMPRNVRSGSRMKG